MLTTKRSLRFGARQNHASRLGAAHFETGSEMLPALLDRLGARQRVEQRVAIVVAHPDDETIAAGGSLRLMPGVLLVHVTDGAPRRLGDAGREGFATAEEYAAAREGEVQAALAVAGVDPERVRLGVADQDASLQMGGIAAELGRLFARHGTEAVLTHAYEGGHPDHDAVAFAVQAAARDRPVFEFAGYHASGGEMVVQRFLPGEAELRVRLDPAEAARKRAMLDCFVTQRDILARFGVSEERFRVAPCYDFGVAPHPGPLNYERWGWELTGARWRELAAMESLHA